MMFTLAGEPQMTTDFPKAPMSLMVAKRIVWNLMFYSPGELAAAMAFLLASSRTTGLEI
jgi:hypothetical protein